MLKRKLQQLILWAYSRFINDLYLPKGTEGFVKFEDGKLSSIKLQALGSKYKKFEDYCFNVKNEQFGYDNINLVRTKLSLNKQ